MASSASSSRAPLLDQGTGLCIINAIPTKRLNGLPLPPAELTSLNSLLGTYLAAKNNKLRPNKDELFCAVQALLKRGSRNLSRQWDKTQLALALFRWVREAFSLGPEHKQTVLTIVINATSESPSELGHEIFLKEEEITETFAIQSPSPSRPGRSGGLESPAANPARGLSREDLDSDFLAVEIDALASFDSLAAIPTLFTPRVLGNSSASAFASPPGWDPVTYGRF